MKRRHIGILAIAGLLVVLFACAGGQLAPEGWKRVQFVIPGCGWEETRIEVRYTLQQFRDAIKINLLTLEGDMDLSFDPKRVSIEQIYDALKETGYPAFGTPRYLN